MPAASPAGDDFVEDVQQLVTYRVVSEGQIVVGQDCPIAFYHIVCRGLVKLGFRSNGNQSTLVSLLTNGQLIEYADLWQEKSAYRSFYAETAQQSQ